LNTLSNLFAIILFFLHRFIFTVVFQIKYFATLNSLAIFIVAAIGADDIFIFMDAYKQSQYHAELLGDFETRMSWVYRRTGTAMAITSATTCAAFLCTLITPLTSIQSFGIFAAFVIFFDYVLVMSLFCTAVVIYHNRFEDRARCGCCCPCGVQNPSVTERARILLEENGDEIAKRDRVSEFFRNKVATFVQVPLHRLVMGVLFLTWISIAIWQASQIEATKENEQFLNEDNPLQKSITIINNEFPTANDDLGLKVYYAWGLEEVSRDGVNRLLEPDNFGTPNFVEGFDFNEQCQSDLLDFCDKLKTDPEYKDLIKRKNGLGEVYCFVEELAAYNVKGDLTDCDYVRTGGWRNETWQVAPSDLADIMPGFLSTKSCYDEDGVETTSGRYSNEIGWDGTRLRYASVSAESNVLDPFGLDAESVTRREYDQFVKIAEEANQIMTKSCTGQVIMTDLDEKFVFMNNQNIYVKSAIQSSILGVAIAFVVLLLSTHVLHLAFFASLSIVCVLVSVVGTMVMLGWYLGSIESILICIIAGFSVDYVVHLAHAYEIAKGDTYARITEAFGDLGISVFNGMITSVVASIPLFFCQLQFFAKFGTFLCLTIAFSWVFANFVFMSLLAQLKIPLKEKGCRL
jgi:predicted RND superfamily exporter protein